MILLDMQTDKAKTMLSQLLLGKQAEHGSDTFAKMLQELTATLQEDNKGATLPFMLLGGDDVQTVETPMLQDTLPKDALLKTQTGKEELLQLLRGQTERTETVSVLNGIEQAEATLLHPNLSRNTPAETLKEVIRDAKQYLQSRIEEVKAPKEMPKTLHGLVRLAEKIGIDVSKITLEQVRAHATAKQPVAETKTPVLPVKEQSPSPQKHTTEELVRTKQPETAQPAPKNGNASKEKADATPLRQLLQDEAQVPKQPLKAVANNTDAEILPAEDAALKQPLQKETRQTHTAAPEEAKKALNSSEHTAALKTEHLPASKAETQSETANAANRQHPTPSNGNRNDNGGQTPQQHSTAAQSLPASDNAAATTADKQPLFGTALSQLLQDEEETLKTPASAAEGDVRSIKEPAGDIKNNTAAVATALPKEELELKIGEAKQMVRHFAADIKEAVQNYKPPFTRIKIQLNPVKLGEVDVTMVQRGNNLHINISSNTTAITTLAQNASELRTQLGQNGMGNATMNFSSNAEQQQQQNHNQQRQHMAELYEAYENSENFELLEQLELIVPRYV